MYNVHACVHINKGVSACCAYKPICNTYMYKYIRNIVEVYRLAV